MLLIVVLVGLLGQIFVKSVACDDPYTPKGKGSAVVEEVTGMIKRSQVPLPCSVGRVKIRTGE